MKFFKFKHYISAICASLLIGFILFSGQQQTAVGASETPFGGPILRTRVCDCSGNTWFQVGSPTPASVIYQPGFSNLYDYGQVFRSGPYALGTYVSGGRCEYGCGNKCCHEPSDGTVKIVGTSR